MKEKRFMMSLREGDHSPRGKNDYVKDGVFMSKLAEKEDDEFPHQYYYLDPIPLTCEKI